MKALVSPEHIDLMLAHHPDLPCFHHDVIMIANRRICAGCLLGYPAAFLILVVIHPYGFLSVVLSLYFAALSQVRRLIRIHPLFDHYCRVLAGIAFGFGIGGLFWAVNTGEWLMAAALGTGAFIYFLSDYYSMKTRLERCRE
jgi:hypothetical protein